MLHFPMVSPPFSRRHSASTLHTYSVYSILHTSCPIHTVLLTSFLCSPHGSHSPCCVLSFLTSVHHSPPMIFSLPSPTSSCHTPYFIPCALKLIQLLHPPPLTAFSALHESHFTRVLHCAQSLLRSSHSSLAPALHRLHSSHKVLFPHGILHSAFSTLL